MGTTRAQKHCSGAESSAAPFARARRILVAVGRLIADDRGYIDPGTGSMLFTILIGAITAGVYALRNAIVKARFVLSGGRQQDVDEERKGFVIFTDSKRYWNVFEPVCDEFEKRGVDLTYYTASPDDPALEKPYEHVKREFIGEGNRAFAKMNMLKADVVLSTTPGLDVYQWKRSRDVSWYAHVTHAASDATMYRMFGTDYYDAVLLSGEFQVKQIRELERLRGIEEKELVLVGLTYMDAMAKRLAEAGQPAGRERTVLLAPSWGASGILTMYGSRIIDALLATGYHVIIRPHPQSFTSEKDMIEGLMAAYPESDQLEWNRDNDNFEVLRRSDIMISDFSGVIFDFALVFDKPVIYTQPAYDKAPYDACWLDEEPWTFDALARIGELLSLDSLDSMKELIDGCIEDPSFQHARDEVRDECWCYRGEAAQRLVDYLVQKQGSLAQEADEADANDASK